MKALIKSQYSELEVSREFNNIILNSLDNYDGTKLEQLKGYLKDVLHAGCQSGFVNEFIYHSDCKEFYIKHIDELEEMRSDYEEELGEQINNKQRLPHYTFMCWFCFEQYCYDLQSNLFDK